MKNIRKLYSLQSQLSSKTFQAHACHLNKTKKENSELFDQHRLILGDYEGIKMPVEFKQEYGKELKDVLDTGWVSLFLVSDRFVEILKAEKISGWKTFPVKVYDKNGSLVNGYEGFSVNGRSGPVNFSEARIIEKQLAINAAPLKFYRGFHIEMDEWDKSDIFLAKDNFTIVVLEKVKDLIEKNKLTNIRFTNLEDIEIPFVE